MNKSEILNPNIDKEKKLPWFHRGHLFPLSENYPTIDKCNDLLFFIISIHHRIELLL